MGTLIVHYFFYNKRLTHSTNRQVPITKERDSKMIRLLICQEEAYSTVGEREAKRKEVNRCQEGILFEVKKKCESKKKKKTSGCYTYMQSQNCKNNLGHVTLRQWAACMKRCHLFEPVLFWRVLSF